MAASSAAGVPEGPRGPSVAAETPDHSAPPPGGEKRYRTAPGRVKRNGHIDMVLARGPQKIATGRRCSMVFSIALAPSPNGSDGHRGTNG